MKKTTLVLTSLLLALPLSAGLFSSPAFAEACPDGDADGYVTLTTPTAGLILGDTFNSNGNYSAAQWQNFFNSYKSGATATPDGSCDNLNFKRGAEPVRCDAPLVDAGSGVYDSSRVSSLDGARVNPTAYDIPSNGIDEDCDGADGQFLPDDVAGAGKDLGNLVQRSISLLGKVVVAISIIILIWGGILYATAAGDEQKTAKARKAIIGAIIGLAIGLLAPTIVNFVAGSLT